MGNPTGVSQTGWRHPAPFPSELAARVIKVFVCSVMSYLIHLWVREPHALQPYAGSAGFDISEKYCEIAEAGLAEELAGERMTAMAHAKTECSELSVGLGAFGVSDPLALSNEDVHEIAETPYHLQRRRSFLQGVCERHESKLYQQLHGTGLAIRTAYPLFGSASSLQWAAPNQQGSTTSASTDLRIANTPVSVKAHHNVVLNASPYNLFVGVPSGGAVADKSENWYLFAAPDAYQALYEIVRTQALSTCPRRSMILNARRRVQHAWLWRTKSSSLHQISIGDFQELYLEMCHQVTNGQPKSSIRTSPTPHKDALVLMC